jgi:hypothetical protein
MIAHSAIDTCYYTLQDSNASSPRTTTLPPPAQATKLRLIRGNWGNLSTTFSDSASGDCVPGVWNGDHVRCSVLALTRHDRRSTLVPAAVIEMQQFRMNQPSRPTPFAPLWIDQLDS